MWCGCDVLYAVLYVCVNWYVVRGCVVWRRYIDVYNSDVFSVVNMYLDHFMLCVLMVKGMSVVVNVMFSLINIMKPPPTLCNLSVSPVVKLCTLGVFAYRMATSDWTTYVKGHLLCAKFITLLARLDMYSAVPPTGFVHKSRGDNVVCM